MIVCSLASNNVTTSIATISKDITTTIFTTYYYTSITNDNHDHDYCWLTWWWWRLSDTCCMPGDTFYWPVNRSDRGSSAVGEEWIRVIAGEKSTSACSSLSSLQHVSCEKRDMCFLHFLNSKWLKGLAWLVLWFGYSLGKKVLRLAWNLAVLNLQL